MNTSELEAQMSEFVYFEFGQIGSHLDVGWIATQLSKV